MIADVTIDKVLDHLATENQIPLDLDVSDPEVRKYIYDIIQGENVINLGGRGITMNVERLISEATGTYIFDKGLQFFKSLEDVSSVDMDDMPRLKGKLVLKGNKLTVIDA